MRDSIFKKEKHSNDDIKIIFTKNIPPEQIQDLFLAVGWQYRNRNDIKILLNRSLIVTSAWYEDLLIGLARANSDGLYSATIWDVAVNPKFQNKGIGRLILQTMLTKLDDYGIPLITLYTHWQKKDFYSKLGFEIFSKKIKETYRHS